MFHLFPPKVFLNGSLFSADRCRGILPLIKQTLYVLIDTLPCYVLLLLFLFEPYQELLHVSGVVFDGEGGSIIHIQIIPLSETQANDSPSHARHEHARPLLQVAAMLQPGTRWRRRASLERAEMLREPGRL